MKDKVQQSIQPVCPVSKSLATYPLCQVDGFEVWRCPESATDFVWPMPSDKTLKELYDREAWFEGGERGGYQDYDAQTEPSLHLVVELLSRFPAGDTELSVLDVGCGYGSHLRITADRGWNCFGVEPSAHARSVAQQRHGDRLTLVEQVEDLLPKRFDLILMLEVIEHLQDPYKLFFTLFGKGAIGPETLVVISTPNARSAEAVSDPGGWAYRHPPSHLVFYSAQSLKVLLSRLLFQDVAVRGVVQLPLGPAACFDDEQFPRNDELSGFLGIVAEARGSDFKGFMHERYVPGAYWKLTEYEHLPRYSLAMQLAQGAKVLDFGCGTGYGTAMLGEVAASVVGMDIAPEAIHWARQTHRSPKLSFEQRADLGLGFAPGSFDLVTCFEMIEHVNHQTQLDTVRSIANMLTAAGKLVISTPDPQFTAPYGDNPYHLREMTEPQFLELLQEGFKHVLILKQWVRPSVLIGAHSMPGSTPVVFGPLSDEAPLDAPVGFVAICSNQPVDIPFQLCVFDTGVDFNRQTLETEHQLNRLRFDNFSRIHDELWLKSQCEAWERTAGQREQDIAALQTQVQELLNGNAWLDSQRDAWEHLAVQREQFIATLQVQELLNGNAWLDSQRDAWEQLAVQREQSIAALQVQVQEVLNGNIWLSSQRDAWEQLAAQRDKTVRTLDAQLRESHDKLAMRDAVLDRIQGHWGMRLINFLSGRKLFGDSGKAVN